MQSWQGLPGQPGADGQQNPNVGAADPNDASWQQAYGFPGNEHFDPNQDWSQTIAGQVPFQQHINSEDSANFFEAHPQHQQNEPFLPSHAHAQQTHYQNEGNQLHFSHQFQQPSQEAIDPSFENINPDLYAQQQGKTSLAVTQSQPLAHHGGLQQRDYAFAHQNDRSYGSPATQQYTQTPTVLQQPHSQSHTPVQQFQNALPGPQQAESFQGQPRQSPVQRQADFAQPAYISQARNGHPEYPQPGAEISFQQQAQQQPHRTSDFSQAQFVPQIPVSYQQSYQGAPVTQTHQFQAPAAQAAASQAAGLSSQHSQAHQVDSPVGQSAPIEAPPKKRKRTVGNATETTSSDVISFQLDSHIDNSTSKLAEIDSLPSPAPTSEEHDLIAKFNKRTKAAKSKFPPIKGLPHLIHSGNVTLPTPKSFDKLAPLVALPPRSGKSVVPEMDYELPCQIQGRFSQQYQPSADKAGLDERRLEAQTLLDEYDGAMKAIGKRQPKYTEYPHAFKEQLKADEANKNKAGKKIKKDGDVGRNKPIRPETRPSDPVEAAAWDAIGIVHIEPSVTRSSALIATRVQQTGDFFIKLRGEMNRAKQELDQATTDKAPETEIANFAKEYELKKKALYRALDAVIEHADDAVLDNLGGHQKLISSLVNVLIFCIKAGDFAGKLPKVALELFTHMPMTRKIAETTNFETVRKRFAEKGDDEAKDLARKIALKVKKALKPAEPEATGGYAGTSAANRAKVAAGKATDSSNTKRARDEDAPDGRSVKKVMVEAGGSSLSKKLAPSKTHAPSATKVSLSKPVPSSILPSKTQPATKPVVKAAEPSKLDAAVAAAEQKSKAEARKAAPKQAASSGGSLSGIGSLLASINTAKPESPAPAPKEVKRAETLETPEQKAKRLRKEARRKLRVSWKPEGELVKVKIFEKEESEDEGRAHNLVKDAADDRSEGMVLKQRADIDEDDEDDDIPYQPWEEPTRGAWTALSEESRNKNFVTRGGNVTFTTDEQDKIRERENRELMAFYHNPDDIPASPKSPPPESASPDLGTAFELPIEEKFQEIHQRWKDEQQMGPDGALYSAIRRLDSQQGSGNKLDTILGRLQQGASSTSAQAAAPSQHPSYSMPSTAPLVIGPAAAEQVMAWLVSEKTKTWQDPEPNRGELRAYQYNDPDTRLAGTAIEALVRYLAPKPYPATSPPDWLLNDAERVREWWQGYNKEVALRQKKAEGERARAEAEANALLTATAAQGQQAHSQDWAAWYAQQQQQQQQQQQPQAPAQQQAAYMALLQQMTGGQQAAQAVAQGQIGDDQLQSILAAINQPGQQLPPPPPPLPASGFPNAQEDQVQKFLAQLAQGAQQQPGVPPPPPPGMQQEEGRDHDWDRGEDDERDWDRDRDHGRGKKMRTLPPHKPINKALIGTKPCTFWQQGKCARGDKCTFRHD